MGDKTIVIEPGSRSLSSLPKELWRYRHLFSYFAGSFVRARYRGTMLGWLWLIIQPLAAALISTGIFSALLEVPSDGVPYVVFFLCGASIWSVFSNSLGFVTRSLGRQSRLMMKLYFPRIIVPVTSVAPVLIQFCVTFLVLIGTAAAYSAAHRESYLNLGPGLLFFPLLVFLAFFFAVGIGLWTCVLNAQARDVRFTLPYVLQMWSYLTPIIYPLSMVPEKWRFLSLLNPMSPVVEGFKWSVLGRGQVHAGFLGVAIFVMLLTFASGVWFFHKSQATIVDNL